jgi:hypothetical protein
MRQRSSGEDRCRRMCAPDMTLQIHKEDRLAGGASASLLAAQQSVPRRHRASEAGRTFAKSWVASSDYRFVMRVCLDP